MWFGNHADKHLYAVKACIKASMYCHLGTILMWQNARALCFFWINLLVGVI